MSSVNYFSLFGLEPAFNLNLAEVRKSFHQQIKQCHPDNFINADESSKLAKLQQTKLLNDAYTTLVHPVKRAFYVLKLMGCDLNANQSMQDLEFLEQGMQLHEQLNELAQSKNVDTLENLSEQIVLMQGQAQEEFAQIYHDQSQQNKAVQLAQRMQFLVQLQIKTNKLLDQIESS